MSKLGKEILKAVKSTIKSKDKGMIVRGAVDVRELRSNLHLTQAEFSDIFKIHIETLRSWEQQKRLPDTISTAYLMCISKAPDVIRNLVN